jgi:Domain of unknown function (DUF3303)
MVFHVTYRFFPEQRNDVQARFLKTGAPPPSGVTMVGRWHGVGSHQGFVVAEASDAEAIAIWLHGWTDLMAFEVTPVLSDEQLTRVLGRAP